MSTLERTRRAAVLETFGDGADFTMTELPMPRLQHPDDVLVQVSATSVNPIEWKMRQGLGLPKRLWRRLIGSPMVLGIDFSGEVVATGADATPYRVGDEVMGVMPIAGADTTHIAVRTRGRRAAIVHKPAGATHAEAALVPFAGLVAYAGLVTYGGLRERDTDARVLIIGASGGVGHLAVQIAANAVGAGLVAGVSSSRNAAFVAGLGAHTVVPYDRIPTTEIPSHFPDWAGTFDLILDCVGDDGYYTELAPWLLKSTGRYVTAALPSFRPGRPGEDVGVRDGAVLGARLARRYATGRYRLIPGLVGLPAADGLPALARWMTEGKLRPHTASTYRLEDLAAAHRESETGRTVGKIAIMVS